MPEEGVKVAIRGGGWFGMNLKRLGLKPKFALSFGSLLAIIAAMGVVGYRTASANQRTAADVQVYSSLKVMTRSLQMAILLQRLGTRDVLMGRDKESTHLLEHGEAEFHEALDQLRGALPTARSRELFGGVELATASYMRRNDGIVASYRAGREAEALEAFKSTESLALTDAVTESVNALAAEFDQRRADALSRQIASDESSKRLLVLFALGGLALGLIVASVIARSILGAVRDMLTMIEAVAANNLAADDMDVETRDEIGKAVQGMNTMKNGLREVILSIARTAVSVSRSSREISAAASQAAVCAEDQKQQTEQIAAAMYEMSATVREVSNHSNRAAEAAQSAASRARDGGRIVEGVRGEMRCIATLVRESAATIEELGMRSNQIGRIVGVIDEIAGQTNLLALNAAIEAARAGEHGRGFGVVAVEVRRLAERITVATTEIASVIEEVQSKTASAVDRIRRGTTAVEQGVEVAGKAGESIEGIIRDADSVGTLVAQIASAATEQAAATEAVTGSMNQINSLAVESAQSSQLSAKACEDLLKLAVGLEKLVERFEVGRKLMGDDAVGEFPSRQGGRGWAIQAQAV